MTNYKNIIKLFAQKINEEQEQSEVPTQEKAVELTQASEAPETMQFEHTDVTLKHVDSIKEFNIEVYESEDGVTYVVGEQSDIEDFAADSWAKQVKSGMIETAAMPWEFIIEQGDVLGVLDTKTAKAVAKALANADLGAAGVESTAEALWGKKLKTIAEQIITIEGINNVGFLTYTDDTVLHDLEWYSNLFAVRWDYYK